MHHSTKHDLTPSPLIDDRQPDAPETESRHAPWFFKDLDAAIALVPVTGHAVHRALLWMRLSGMNADDLHPLRVEDVNLQLGCFRVGRGVPYLPLHPQLQAELSAWLPTRGQNERLFPDLSERVVGVALGEALGGDALPNLDYALKEGLLAPSELLHGTIVAYLGRAQIDPAAQAAFSSAVWREHEGGADALGDRWSALVRAIDAIPPLVRLAG